MENPKLILKKKYKRFFAFGCSYTDYIYSTWADVIAYELNIDSKNYVNLGKAGAGNLFLLSRLTQANKLYRFNKNDLIMVMYPSYTREDVFNTDHWICSGSVFHSGENSNGRNYDIDRDFLYFIIRDYAIIDSIRNYLKSLTSTTFEMLSVPAHGMENNLDLSTTQISIAKRLENTYNSNFLDFYTPYSSFLNNLHDELQKNNKFEGVVYDNHHDPHPNPYSAMEYLKHIGFELSDSTIEYFMKEYHLLSRANLSIEDIREITKPLSFMKTYDQLIKSINII